MSCQLACCESVDVARSGGQPPARRRLRHPPRPGDRRRSVGPEAREHRVLRQLARERSNQEIADDLVVGVETVKSHVSEVLRKLGLRDRIQLVVDAYEHGLIVPGE